MTILNELKNKRLMMISEMLPRCDKMADIGTDHAWLPIYAVSNGICKSAVAGDVKKGPIAVAQKNISEYGIGSKIETRLGSGLSVLLSDFETCDAAVIAGMGGLLICDILNNDIEIAKSLKTLILQPNTSEYELREYLYLNGFEIIDEQACRDGRHTYVAMKCRYSGEVADKNITPEKQLEFFTGSIMPKRKSKSDMLYFEKLKNKAEKVTEGINSAETSNEFSEKRLELYKRLFEFTREILSGRE